MVTVSRLLWDLEIALSWKKFRGPDKIEPRRRFIGDYGTHRAPILAIFAAITGFGRHRYVDLGPHPAG
jgi:hypothetical protein